MTWSWTYLALVMTLPPEIISETTCSVACLTASRSFSLAFFSRSFSGSFCASLTSLWTSYVEILWRLATSAYLTF